MKRNIFVLFFVVTAAMTMTACTPEVGSVAWCKAMDEKSKMDWSARELRDYTKHCLDRK